MSTLDKVKEEVHFWLRNINAVNRYHIKQNHVLTKVVYSDANKQGYGDYMVQKMGEQIARGNCKLALQIFDLRIKLDLMIIPCWVRREEYEFADASSKCRDTDDWSIDGESILYIQQRFGMSIDRFPDKKNAKLPRFDARFNCPGAEMVNTFTANWANEFNLGCPPYRS